MESIQAAFQHPDSQLQELLLEDLNLNSNLIAGPIPTTFGFLENLKELNLRENELTSVIPTEIGLIQVHLKRLA